MKKMFLNTEHFLKYIYVRARQRVVKGIPTLMLLLRDMKDKISQSIAFRFNLGKMHSYLKISKMFNLPLKNGSLMFSNSSKKDQERTTVKCIYSKYRMTFPYIVDL